MTTPHVSGARHIVILSYCHIVILSYCDIVIVCRKVSPEFTKVAREDVQHGCLAIPSPTDLMRLPACRTVGLDH